MISFISEAWGRVSDMYLIENSAWFAGTTSSGLCHIGRQGVQHPELILPFKTTQQDGDLYCVCIHVERLLVYLNKYTILESQVPINFIECSEGGYT